MSSYCQSQGSAGMDSTSSVGDSNNRRINGLISSSSAGAASTSSSNVIQRHVADALLQHNFGYNLLGIHTTAQQSYQPPYPSVQNGMFNPTTMAPVGIDVSPSLGEDFVDSDDGSSSFDNDYMYAGGLNPTSKWSPFPNDKVKKAPSQKVLIERAVAKGKAKTERVQGFSKPGVFVTIIVGQEITEEFIIHKHLICGLSDYFAAVFTGSFEEGEKQILRLDDVEIDTFGLFSQWLYTNEIVMDKDVAGGDFLVTLAKLWILAERCLLPELQNSAAKMMFHMIFDFHLKIIDSQPILNKNGTAPCLTELMHFVYGTNTAATDNVLKGLLIAYWAWRASSENLKKVMAEVEIPGDLLLDTIAALKDYGNDQYWPGMVGAFMVEVDEGIREKRVMSRDEA